MFEILLRQLTVWRNEKARIEGIEPFRILPNKALEEIARNEPASKEDLILVKGVKEAKFAKYGREILKIVKDNSWEGGKENKTPRFWNNIDQEMKAQEKEIFSVGEFLDILNEQLMNISAKVRGEVSSLDERERVVYFSIKDEGGEGVINCLIFRSQYEMLGVKLEEGARIIVEGRPEIYKPYGKLSLKADIIEMEGEGALKKEYEELKKRLEKEGFFEESEKKRFKKLPQSIGLITSREGAAIGDFMSNVGHFGLKIKLISSSVEGKRAIFELIAAIRSFEKADIDALVVIRGGGSLESLQAFNNEALIRESRKIKVPIVCGVGHDRDISLFSLAADYSVSTPTAAARLIGGLWENEINKIDFFERNILESYFMRIRDADRSLRNASLRIEGCFGSILRNTELRCDEFSGKALRMLEIGIKERKVIAEEFWRKMDGVFCECIFRTRQRIERSEDILKLNDPRRQLRLGYSIISRNGICIKSIEDVRKEESVKIRVWDGEMDAEITGIKKFKE